MILKPKPNQKDFIGISYADLKDRNENYRMPCAAKTESWGKQLRIIKTVDISEYVSDQRKSHMNKIKDKFGSEYITYQCYQDLIFRNNKTGNLRVLE